MSRRMVEDYFHAVREIERGKKKEEEKSPEKKLLHHDWDLNPQTLPTAPSVLSVRPRLPAFFGLCQL